MSAVVHIAGLEVRIGRLSRQRCAWCGALLWDHDPDSTASVHVGGEGSKPFELHGWRVNGLVEVNGNVTIALPDPPDGKLPDNACDKLRPAVLS